MSDILRNIKATIGGKESTPGTAVARDQWLPITNMPTLDRMPTSQPDPAYTGQNMEKGDRLMSASVEGGFGLGPRPVPGFGKILASAFGTSGTPTQLAAIVRIKYSGSEDSCKIIVAGDVITSQVGALGAETDDTNFGVSGDLDVTGAGYDTPDELVDTIDGYADYEAELLMGDGDTTIAGIQAITAAQGKDRWVLLIITSASSGLYAHEFKVSPTASTERPTYSIQIDGKHDDLLYAGCVVDTLSLSGAVKAFLESTVGLLGFSETGDGVTASAVAQEEEEPYIYQQGGFSLGGYSFPFARNFNLSYSNGHNPDGYGMGSLDRQYHQKGTITATLTAQVRYEANLIGLRPKQFDNAVVGAQLYFRVDNYLGDLPSLLIVNLPYLQITKYDFTENGDRIDGTLNCKAIAPAGLYGSPIEVTLITTDSTAY